MKEGLSTVQDLAQQQLATVKHLSDGMKKVGEQVQRHEKIREVLFPVPKIMLQMVALRLENVVVFVLYLPSAAPIGDHTGNVLRTAG